MSDTKSEFNINVIAVYALVVLLVSALIVTVVVKMASTIAHSSNPQVDESATARIAPVAKLEVAKAKVAGAAERSGEEIYTVACVACHGSGAAGAPKTGDAAAWKPRLALGLDGLLKSAIAGKGAMPPRGGSDASDTELARAIAHMANASGGKLKAP
jgi:cytochrome c5